MNRMSDSISASPNVRQAQLRPGHGLAARPGKGPCDQDQTGQRVPAVAIVFSLLTWPARKITTASATAVPPIQTGQGKPGSLWETALDDTSTGRGRAKRA